jgi:hypothetical protein
MQYPIHFKSFVMFKKSFIPAFSLPYSMLSLMGISAGTSSSFEQALGGICKRLGAFLSLN